MKKKYMIPISSMVVLTCQGCTDPIIGEWEIVEAFDVVLPASYTYTDYAYSYTLKLSALDMDVDANFDGNARFKVEVDYTYYGYTGHYEFLYTYDVNITTLRKRSEYRIELNGETDSFRLDCVMSAKELLECEDDDNEDWEFLKY